MISIQNKFWWDIIASLSLKKYEELVSEHYKEPINGTFDDATESVLEAQFLAKNGLLAKITKLNTCNQ